MKIPWYERLWVWYYDRYPKLTELWSPELAARFLARRALRQAVVGKLEVTEGQCLLAGLDFAERLGVIRYSCLGMYFVVPARVRSKASD